MSNSTAPRLSARGAVSLRCLSQATVSQTEVSTELVIELLAGAGLDPEGRDAAGVRVEDELSTLLTEALLRSPALAAHLEVLLDV